MKMKRGDRRCRHHNSPRFTTGGLAQEHGTVIKSRRQPAAVLRPGERLDGRATVAAVRTIGMDFIQPHSICGFASRLGQANCQPIAVMGKSETENGACHIQVKCYIATCDLPKRYRAFAVAALQDPSIRRYGQGLLRADFLYKG